MPVRIQRKRTKGGKMPENTVYVGRGSTWGNPFPVTEIVSNSMAVDQYKAMICGFMKLPSFLGSAIRGELQNIRGKNLACWCPLDEPCHADVLLELANSPLPQPPKE